MFKIIGSAFAVVVSVTLLSATTLHDPWRPDFGWSHDAFVCNYEGSICKDKTAVLPISWRRYVGDL